MCARARARVTFIVRYFTIQGPNFRIIELQVRTTESHVEFEYKVLRFEIIFLRPLIEVAISIDFTREIFQRDRSPFLSSDTILFFKNKIEFTRAAGNIRACKNISRQSSPIFERPTKIESIITATLHTIARRFSKLHVHQSAKGIAKACGVYVHASCAFSESHRRVRPRSCKHSPMHATLTSQVIIKDYRRFIRLRGGTSWECRILVL